MNVRALSPDETDRFVDDLWFPLAREMAALEAHDALADNAWQPSVEYHRGLAARDDAGVWVAVADDEDREDDGAWVGHVAVQVRSSPPVFARGADLSVEELYVLPDHRGEGVAVRLLDRAEVFAREQDCERLTLSVHPENDAARSLYEERGYDVRRLRMDRSV